MCFESRNLSSEQYLPDCRDVNGTVTIEESVHWCCKQHAQGMTFHLPKTLEKSIITASAFTMDYTEVSTRHSLVMEGDANTTAEADEGGVETTRESWVVNLGHPILVLTWSLTFILGRFQEGKMNFDSGNSMFDGSTCDGQDEWCMTIMTPHTPVAFQTPTGTASKLY